MKPPTPVLINSNVNMPILAIMKVFFASLLILTAAELFAFPLESGYTLAPKSTASESEKAKAYVNARLRVIEESRKYLGTPYVYGGMTASGIDCSGFTSLSFKDALGVTLPRSAAGQYSWTVRTTIERAQPGDLLFFRTSNNNDITHVGLYLGDRRFIHSASAGTSTGVIYSSLDESYWARTFAGAGRAFPDVPAEYFTSNTSNTSVAAGADGTGGQSTGGQVRINTPAGVPNNTPPGRLLAGAAIAPVWNSFMQGGELMRGISGQLYIYADTYSLGTRMVFGLELRPEYDGALGIFSLPITLSWGPNEKLRVFLGPVINMGDTVVQINGNDRRYQSGVNWLGIIGFTAAPFEIKSSGGIFSPYLELSWQSYSGNNQTFDFIADFSAGFRFSTGIRWLIQIK